MPFYQKVGNLQDQLLDELVALTAKLCRVPIAFISLLEEETVWFKHTIGWAGAERLPVGYTLCSVAILQQTPTLFLDLKQEPCRQINSREIEALRLHFYLGVPLRTAQGKSIGVFAILDEQPHQLLPPDRTLLGHFAELVSILLVLYGTPAQPHRPWELADSQVYETIVQSMGWMHKLAEQAEVSRLAAPKMPQDYQHAIGQEAHKLTCFIQQYLVGTTEPLLSNGSVLG